MSGRDIKEVAQQMAQLFNQQIEATTEPPAWAVAANELRCHGPLGPHGKGEHCRRGPADGGWRWILYQPPEGGDGGARLLLCPECLKEAGIQLIGDQGADWRRAFYVAWPAPAWRDPAAEAQKLAAAEHCSQCSACEAWIPDGLGYTRMAPDGKRYCVGCYAAGRTPEAGASSAGAGSKCSPGT